MTTEKQQRVEPPPSLGKQRSAALGIALALKVLRPAATLMAASSASPNATAGRGAIVKLVDLLVPVGRKTLTVPVCDLYCVLRKYGFARKCSIPKEVRAALKEVSGKAPPAFESLGATHPLNSSWLVLHAFAEKYLVYKQLRLVELVPSIESALQEEVKARLPEYEDYVLLGGALGELWGAWVTPGGTGRPDCFRDRIFTAIAICASRIGLNLSAEIESLENAMLTANSLDERAVALWSLYRRIRNHILFPSAGDRRDANVPEGKQLPSKPPPPPAEPEPCRCGLQHHDDFANLEWKKKQYTLSKRERKAFKVLHDRYVKGHPDVSLDTLYKVAESSASGRSGRDLFRSSGLWRDGLIKSTPDRRAFVRLALP
jgi:hypothetical protein